MENKLSRLEKFSQISQFIITCLMVFIAIWFSLIASDISKKEHFAAVKPLLEISPATNFDADFSNLIVQVKNIGLGTAYKVRIIIIHNDKILNHAVFHLFTNPGEFSIANLPGRQQDALTLGPTLGKDYIMCNETVEFKCVAPEGINAKNIQEQIYTYCISYYDIDNNEYLTVTKQPAAGGVSGLTIGFYKDIGLTDSLMSIAKSVKNFQSITLDNINIRAMDGSFKDLSTNRIKKNNNDSI